MTPEQVAEQVRISDEPRQHADWIPNDFNTGADAVYLNHVDSDVESAVEIFLKEVATHLSRNPKITQKTTPQGGREGFPQNRPSAPA